ncbi:MAG: hypothetical protein QJR05_04915, partial [Thermoanaerobacterium sp.]|nr:hypothetical protein [Thermoanaerobacterium sp.]
PKPNMVTNDAKLNSSKPDFKTGPIKTAPIKPTAGDGHKKRDKIIITVPTIQKVLLGEFRNLNNGFVITISAPMSSSARDMAIIKDMISITCQSSFPETKTEEYKISIDLNTFLVCDNATAKIPTIQGKIMSFRKTINKNITNIEIK